MASIPIFLQGFLKGRSLGPLLFLIYINDLFDNLSSNPKLFADDASLFSVMHDINQSKINFKKAVGLSSGK